MIRPAFTRPGSPLFPWLVFLNVIIATMMAFSSTGITIIADQTIQGELGLSSPEASWLTTLILLGLNSTVPASTWLGERFGYRKVYAIGTLIFTIGSGFAGLASNFWVLAVCRFIEGIGSGLIVPIGLAMIVRNMPKERLSLALNLYIALGFGGGLGLGITCSGYFSQFLSWRDLFLTFIPIGALLTIDCWMFHEDKTPKQEKSFDFWGFLSLITFVASLLVALSFGPLRSTSDGWKEPFILWCFGIAAITLIATLIIESRHPSPVIPLPLFKNTLFTLCFLIMLLLGMAFFSSVSTFVNFMLNALEYERYIVGEISAAYGFSIGISSVIASQLMKKIHPTFLTFAGLGLLITSYFLNNQITLQSYPGQIVSILVMRGIGIGLSLGPTTAFAMSSIPRELAGAASTLITFARQVGGTYGGAVLTILAIKRKIYHVARFSETVNPQNQGYQATYQKLHTQFFSSVSDKSFLAGHQAKLEIVKDIEIQAYIQALNDGMMVYGWITLAVAFLLLFFIILKRRIIFQKKSS